MKLYVAPTHISSPQMINTFPVLFSMFGPDIEQGHSFQGSQKHTEGTLVVVFAEIIHNCVRALGTKVVWFLGAHANGNLSSNSVEGARSVSILRAALEP